MLDSGFGIGIFENGQAIILSYLCLTLDESLHKQAKFSKA